MTDEPKIYLGDGVYAYFDGYHFWLYTSDGVRNSEAIALEPQVIAALLRFRKDTYEKHGVRVP